MLSGKDLPLEDILGSCKYLQQNIHGTFQLKVKHKYYAQVQLCMSVLNLETCDFIVYSSFEKKFVKIVVPLDHNFAVCLITKLKDIFFHKMLHTLCTN